MTDDRRVAKSRRRAHHLAAQTVSEIRWEERPRLLVEAPEREADFAAGLARLRAWLERALEREMTAKEE